LLSAFCTISAWAAISTETRWADPSRVSLDVEFPGDGYHASWELYRCACGDLLVRSELNAPGEVDKGETLLVGGRAMLSRGFGDEQAELGASLDAPALMMQLTLRLLERSEPGGPGKVDKPVMVDLLEEINHIHLETGGAIGGFQAPWSIEGKLSPAGATERKFDLRFTFSAGPPGDVQEASMRLSGLAEFADSEFPLNGDSSLEGWDIHWRDENDKAAGLTRGAKTLDDLRALIRAND
jgi:hypothetical protein